MVIDSSAVIAILFDEPECEALLSQIAAAGACRLSAATLVEIGIVLRRDVAGQRRAAFGEMSRPFSITIEPVSEGQGLLGPRRLRSVRQGHRPSGWPELRRLFSYALAKQAGEPLLFKGADFIHADLEAAC